MKKRMTALLCILALCMAMAACAAEESTTTEVQAEPAAASAAPSEPESEPEPPSQPESEPEPQTAPEPQDEPAPEAEEEDPFGWMEDEGVTMLQGSLVVHDFGSFMLPAGWVEWEEKSSPERLYYVREGASTDSYIIVALGENSYTAEESYDFQLSIMQQYFANLSEETGEEEFEMEDFMMGTLTTTFGYDVILHSYSKDGVSLTQYYIVGEYKHIMVLAVNDHTAYIPDIEEAASTMVSLFTWAE